MPTFRSKYLVSVGSACSDVFVGPNQPVPSDKYNKKRWWDNALRVIFGGVRSRLSERMPCTNVCGKLGGFEIAIPEEFGNGTASLTLILILIDERSWTIIFIFCIN